MKKGKFLRSIIIILIVLCAACSAEQPVAVEGEVEAEASIQEDESMYIVNDSVNMRKGPSTDEQIEDVLYEGEEVSFLSADGSWFEVSNGEAEGFVHQSYFDLPDQESESAGRDVLILMYHAIDEYKGSGSKELYVTPENFESQMQYLKSEGFTPITFADLDHLKGIPKACINYIR
ncbi:SH3 domain-containing protein [Cytobacillus horneckiae]|uniref:SH3 domain-containing protein n=1 Tax=Cytobacillus horneckiae TaxID=549687 RepID=UPI003D9A22A6